MISPASSINPTAVAYSGGVSSMPRPGFGATLAAKLAEFQTVTPNSSILHHHDQSKNAGALTQGAAILKQQDSLTGLMNVAIG